MHPVITAFNSLLPLNGTTVDVYIRTATTPGFHQVTGVKTSSRTKYPRIQAVECPIDNMLVRALNVQMSKQRYTSIILLKVNTIPATPKLNDYVFLRNQRYEIAETTLIAGQVYMLGLNHWSGDKREIIWDVYIQDSVTYSESVTDTP